MDDLDRHAAPAPRRSLGLVTLVVREYEEAIRFFVHALGLRLLENTDLGGGKRWVIVAPDGGAALLLARAADPRQRASVGNQTGGAGGVLPPDR